MKRTIALILALVMVLPVSFISALAHGPGVGKNSITNQSIHNAMNQPLPEVVYVDGKYDDTAWDKDEWNTVNKRTGTWDTNAPANVNFSYKYQIKMDGDYLYGVFALASGASEITIWLNEDETKNSKASDTIVIGLNGTSVTSYTINGAAPSNANGTDSQYPAEQFQIKSAADTVEKGMTVVEFRAYRKAFASGEKVTYFVAAKNGDDKLYYPVIATNGETAPATPDVAWPANAIVITRRDMLDPNSGKHLPVNSDKDSIENQYEINIDGRLHEPLWIYMSDMREQDRTSHQFVDMGNNGKEALLDLTLGGNHKYTGYSNVHGNAETPHTHSTASGYNCGLGNGIDKYDGQIKFKYDVRTDGSTLYGAVVVYDRIGLSYHNIPDDSVLGSDGSTTAATYRSWYANTTYLNVKIYNSNAKLIRILHLVYNSSTGGTTVQLYDGDWGILSDLTDEYNSSKNAGSMRPNNQLVTYEFKIPAKYIFDEDATALDSEFQVSMEAYEAPMTNAGGQTDTNARPYDAYARCYAFKVPAKTHDRQAVYVSGLYMNGSISNSEWNNLNAADAIVDGAFKSGHETSGTGDRDIRSYIYDVVADRDYIYGSAIILTDTSIKQNNTSKEATTFRLWLNDNGTNNAYTNITSFYMGTEGDTRVHIQNSDGSVTEYVKDGKYFVKSNSTEKAYGLEAVMRVAKTSEMIDEYQTLYPDMYTAISEGRVAVLEYKIPLDMAGTDMPTHKGEKTDITAFTYYTSAEDGLNSGYGLVHPMQNTKNSVSGTSSYNTGKTFTPAKWDTAYSANKVFYASNVLDTFKIDGMRTEFYWNSFEDYIGVNASTGYYGEIQESNNTFAFGQTIYVGNDKLYGYAILDDEAVANRTEFVLWINNDPSNTNVTTYTHSFNFVADDDGKFTCTAFNSDDTEIDVSGNTNCVYVVGNTINGRSSIEFMIDLDIFDEDRSGFEYVVSATHEVNKETLQLFYPATDAYDKLFVTHINQTSSNKKLMGQIFSYDEYMYYNDKGEYVSRPNGWADRYYVFNPTGTPNEYKVVYAGYPNGDTSVFNVIEEDGFIYGLYDSGYESTPTAFGNGYIADCDAQFTVGATVKFKGTDFDLSKKVDGVAENSTYGYELDALDISFSVKKTDADDRNANFPENDVWYSTALSVDTLDYFYPEIIHVDGNLNDSGWDDNGWTEVKETENGVLQSADYENNYASNFNYKYQMRTDGENVYFAFVVYDRNFAELLNKGTNDDGKIITSVPSIRVWIKSHDEKYNDAVSFTHLYDVRYGISKDQQNLYHQGSTYGSTSLEITKEDLEIHGQTHAGHDYYLGNVKIAGTNGQDDRYSAATYDSATKKITYTNTHLRFAEHQPNPEGGYLFPWGGNARPNGVATCVDQGYGSSLLYGETEEIMENWTSGAHGSDYTWYAYTDTKGFEVGNEHGRWNFDEQTNNSYVEFKFNLAEIGCEDGEGFEYFVHGASSGETYTAPYTMFNPTMTHIPYSANRSCTIYSLPFWNFDEVTSLKYNASTEYSHMLRNNYRPAVSLGAKINTNYEETGTYAIRFGGVYTEEYIRRLLWGATNMDDKGYYRIDAETGEKKYLEYDNGNGSDGILESPDRIKGGANMDGITNYWDASKVGIVFKPTHLVGKTEDGELELFEGTANSISADSVGIQDWKESSNFADYQKYVFYVTFNGIPKNSLDVKFSFRSFITYYEWWEGKFDGSPAVYDHILERSWNDVKDGAEIKDELENEDTPGADVGGEPEKNFNGKTIAYIPLDNRPVNVDRAIYLAQSAGFNIIMPDMDDIATEIDNADTSEYESAVGDTKAVFAWLKEAGNPEGKYGDIDYFVISLDQLLSGGLVASRDFAGINDLDDATSWANDKDGTFYDPNLEFESDVVEYLAEELTADKENKVVFFDSQMRLASTGQFNGYSSNNGATVNGVIRDNHYYFLRDGYALQQRPTVNLSDANALQKIFDGYDHKANGDFVYGKSIEEFSDNDYVTMTINSKKYEIQAKYIKRYLASRERKMKISEMLFNSGVVDNSEYFYIGIDDSNPNESIQTQETAWLKYQGEGIDGFSLFSGIDEIGLMSMAALVTSCYGGVNTYVDYFGPGEDYKNHFGVETLKETIDIHIKGAGASILGTPTATKDYLHVLVLTAPNSNVDDFSTAADAKYIKALIDKAVANIKAGIPTCIVDGTQEQRALGNAIMERSDLEISKLLGYSNWNTVANATGLSISPAIARFSYLRNSDVITDASHAGALKQISYSFIKDIAYTNKWKKQWGEDNTYSGTGDKLTNRKNCANDSDSFYTWKDKIVTRINGGTSSDPADNAAWVMTSVGNYESIGQIKVVGELYWPWNRMFEASFNLGVKGMSNHALAGEVSFEKASGTVTYVEPLNDGLFKSSDFSSNLYDPETWWSTAPYYDPVAGDNVTEVTINLKDVKTVNAVILHMLDIGTKKTEGGITVPDKIEIYGYDLNTKQYVLLDTIDITRKTDSTLTGAWPAAYFDSFETNSIRVNIYKIIENGNEHNFFDEIQVW